jgi:hypothetical protein
MMGHDIYNPTTRAWEPFDPSAPWYVDRCRVAAIALRDEQLLGLLKGELSIDGIPTDAELYTDADGNAVHAQDGDSKGVWLGVRSKSFDPIPEGSKIPTLNVKFVSVEK